MKNFSILLIALIAISINFCSCGSDSDNAVRDKAKESLPSTDANKAAEVTKLNSNTSVAHYICPNNCAGSGGAGAGTCPVCGAEYVHNQAFHDNPAPAGDGSAASTQLSAPAQNAKGVYHYICDKGCAGGAAAAGNCATCGGALTHNAAFHDEQ